MLCLKLLLSISAGNSPGLWLMGCWAMHASVNKNQRIHFIYWDSYSILLNKISHQLGNHWGGH